jgi:hypothetical protein
VSAGVESIYDLDHTDQGHQVDYTPDGLNGYCTTCDHFVWTWDVEGSGESE